MKRWLILVVLLCAGVALGNCIIQSMRANVTHGGGGNAAPQGWNPDTNCMTLFINGLTNSLGGTADGSGYGNTGTVVGATYTVLGTNTDSSLKNFGRVKYGWTEDAIDDVITIPANQSIQGGPNTYYLYVPVIVTMWVKPTAQPAYGHLAYCGEYGSTFMWGLTTESHAVPYYWGPLTSTIGAPPLMATNNTGITLNVWTHLASVYYYSTGGASGYMHTRLYVNGVFVGMSAPMRDALIPNNSAIKIGVGAIGGFSGTAKVFTDFKLWTNHPASTSDTNVDYAAIGTLISNVWWNTGGRYTNQPWMSDENGY